MSQGRDIRTTYYGLKNFLNYRYDERLEDRENELIEFFKL